MEWLFLAQKSHLQRFLQRTLSDVYIESTISRRHLVSEPRPLTMDAGSQKYLSAGQMLADSVHVIRFSDSLYHSKHLRIFIISYLNVIHILIC